MSQNEAGTLTCPSCYKITPDCIPSQLPKHLKIERKSSWNNLVNDCVAVAMITTRLKRSVRTVYLLYAPSVWPAIKD